MSDVRPAPIDDYWTIAFTGHRQLSDPDAIGRAIAGELKTLRSQVSGNLSAISSIAFGADTLFAREAIHAQIPWIALLPFPQEEFQKDFYLKDEPPGVGDARWAEAVKCLDQAIYIDIWQEKPDRPNAYQDVGINMIEEADILIAVWDGDKERGLGGTALMVDYARERRMPLVLIDARTGAIEREHWPARFQDAVFDAFSRLPPPDAVSPGWTPLEFFFHQADDAATRGLPKIRHQAKRIVLYNTLAAFVIGGSAMLHLLSVDLATLALVLVGAGFYAAVRLEAGKRKETLFRTRLVAEIGRSILETIDFPDRLADLYECRIPHLAHTVRALLWNRDVEWARQGNRTDRDLGQFRDRYIAHRLEGEKGQIEYYHFAAQKSSPYVKRYAEAAYFASLAAVLVAGLIEILGLWEVGGNPLPVLTGWITRASIPTDVRDYKWLGLAGIAAPLVASFFTAMLAVDEHKRRAARYREMEILLTNAQLRLKNVLTHRGIRRLVVETEGALLSENYQWYYQAVEVETH